ncbi:MAG: isochorismatase family protein [Oscillospiraceae bacterium]|jgi:nicotinamidase-related amidase|nr:isochorismatase family protein [Oscillospiraceae bacterium]
MKSALLLVDIQNDYFPGGRCELYQPEQSAEKAKLLLEQFRNRRLPVFHIQHISENRAKGFFLPGTEGAEIYSSVSPIKKERVLVKHKPNAFVDTGLEDLLHTQDIEQLVICGMMSHMCVDSTVRAAKDLGFFVLLPEDACTTKALIWNGADIPAQTVHQAFMASLSSSFAQVVKTQDLLGWTNK